jgi:hypothetical protein
MNIINVQILNELDTTQKKDDTIPKLEQKKSNNWFCVCFRNPTDIIKSTKLKDNNVETNILFKKRNKLIVKNEYIYDIDLNEKFTKIKN